MAGDPPVQRHEGGETGVHIGNPGLRLVLLVVASVFVVSCVFEIAIRIVNPFPCFPDEEINGTEHGNLSEYDPALGWRGVPNGKAFMTTREARVLIEHNSAGFRDIEHPPRDDRPSIVILGDSFAWGYNVEQHEMFASLLRPQFPDFELYNLSHRGYGTDQELLTFKSWGGTSPRLVVLLFCENDFEDNASNRRYEKSKPRFDIIDDALVLGNVPVPRDDRWSRPEVAHYASVGPSNPMMRRILLRSQFIHDLFYRVKVLRTKAEAPTPPSAEAIVLTERLLIELKREVEARGARLLVVPIPSLSNTATILARLQERMALDLFDLAPFFASRVLATSFRTDPHWNARGHATAAAALAQALRARLQR